MRARTTETGLNRIELAEDQLELLGDVGMRVGMRAQTSGMRAQTSGMRAQTSGMRAQTSPEIQELAVDLEGDRTMLAARPAKASRRRDFDPLRDAIRADLNSKRSDLRRHARQTMGPWRRTRRHLELWTGLAALSALRLGLYDAYFSPPVPLAALRHRD